MKPLIPARRRGIVYVQLISRLYNRPVEGCLPMFKVLVVEDDRDLRQLFARVLQRSGYETLEAGDGQQALEVIKPVNVNEMVLRVGALLRRAQMISERREVLGGTVLQYDEMTVCREGESVTLPQKEFQLLYKMAAAPGRIFTRQQIMDDIWGLDTETDPHTVDVHIGRLRDRFRENPDFEIVTMRGIGYKVVKKA